MNIVFIQGASGPVVNGPTVRVPFGNYRVEKIGSCDSCLMYINNADPIELNSKVILSNNSSIRMVARKTEGLTVKFIRED